MELITQLAEQGIAYLLLAISLLTIAYLYRELKALQEKRLQDLRESRDAILDPLKNIQKSLDFLLKLLEKPGKS